PGATALVVGAGTVGLLLLAALRRFTPAGPVLVAARHPAQRVHAASLGAAEVVEPAAALAAVRRATGAFRVAAGAGADALLGGAVYPLSHWREALDHARDAGRLGTGKVAFDPRLR